LRAAPGPAFGWRSSLIRGSVSPWRATMAAVSSAEPSSITSNSTSDTL
jgi:hypothetical protein